MKGNSVRSFYATQACFVLGQFNVETKAEIGMAADIVRVWTRQVQSFRRTMWCGQDAISLGWPRDRIVSSCRQV